MPSRAATRPIRRPGTEINLALCNEKQSKVASAWGWYRTAAGLADQRNQKDRADLARGEATKLEPKLHKLVDLREGLDRRPRGDAQRSAVPNAILGTDAPIDPGDYTIEVNAKGKKPWKQTVHIAAGPGIDRLDVPAARGCAGDGHAGAGPGRRRPPATIGPRRAATTARRSARSASSWAASASSR